MQSALCSWPFKPQDPPPSVTGTLLEGCHPVCPSITEVVRSPGTPLPPASQQRFLVHPKAAGSPAAPGVTAAPRKSPPSRAAPRSVCKHRPQGGKLSLPPNLGIYRSYPKARPRGQLRAPAAEEVVRAPDAGGQVGAAAAVPGRPWPQTPGS